MKTTKPVLAALAASLLLGACSGDGDAVPVESTAPTQAATPDVPASSSRTEVEVEIDDFAYDPGTTEVGAGTAVIWTNVDPALHSVTAGTPDDPRPELFDLDPINDAGQTVSHTFEESGTFEYFCRYHDFMVGTVQVSS